MAGKKKVELTIVPSEIASNDLSLVMKQESEKRKVITQYIKKHMKDGVDYGTLTIGGRESKPSLLKPGSEKFISLFKLKTRFEKDIDTWEMAGAKPGVFAYKCILTTAQGEFVGEGRGVSAMTEKTWSMNNAVKIAEKRAQIDAVLRTGALSDFFTQDMTEEEFDHEEIADDAPVIVMGAEEEPDPKALRAQIAEILTRKGIDYKDRKAAEQYVADETQLALVESNYAEIIRILNR